MNIAPIFPVFSVAFIVVYAIALYFNIPLITYYPMVGEWHWTAQPKLPALRNDKRRLRQIHLPGDGLQPAIFLPGGQKADGSRVAGERAVGEGIDVEEG